MSRKNRTDEVNELRAKMEKLQEEKAMREKESRKAKFPELMQLAIAAMRAARELTWHNKKGQRDETVKTELVNKVVETTKAFTKAYREIVRNDLKRWWGAELQKQYIQGAPEALLVYYLSDNPDATKPLAYTLKKAAEDYVRGWEMLGKKNRKELPGPIEVKGNGALAVQILIERLQNGDELQKLQAQILEKVFEDPISALGQKDPEVKGFRLGETLG
ncbi:MAG: hypothetical protein M1155_00290 [Patescibacteria group bacterium]|nr:hypothetical protein [Patescibacteria group bacterium]